MSDAGSMSGQTLCDRAVVAAAVVLRLVESAPQDELRYKIEDYLRDEFADVVRQVVAGVFNEGERP